MFQEKVIPEEEEVDEEEEREEEVEEVEEENEEEEEDEHHIETSVTKASNPYESAIEGYKTFALTQQPPSAPLSTSSKESSPSSSSSSGTSSLSSASSPPRKETPTKGEDQWEEKIETFVQPSRRVSSEVSETMRQKMASFTGVGKAEKEASPPVRTIGKDNKFQDKLKAFKTIETAAVREVTPPSMSRRESEPVLGRARASPPYKTSLTSASSSSSFMNTIQNAKFFQQNSLGSEEQDDEDDDEDAAAMEDALEESFNVLEGGAEPANEPLVFSADDFVPLKDRSLPPQEKPPPLPAAPPPPPPAQEQEETEIDKQEREIIESLEREEQEHKIYLETLTTSTSTSTEERSSVSTQSVHSTLWQAGEGAGAGAGLGAGSGAGAETGAGARRHEGQGSMPVKKKESRDYSKHWLIQEAEQRRIAEAQQKQNLNLAPSSSLEKIENINNNNSPQPGEKRREHLVTDNIYANVDATNLNFNANHQSSYPGPQGEGPGGVASIPGPQVRADTRCHTSIKVHGVGAGSDVIS